MKAFAFSFKLSIGISANLLLSMSPSFKNGYLVRAFCLILALQGGLTPCWARLSIERTQRKFQERNLLVNPGSPLLWKNCLSCGVAANTPPFPMDEFYGNLDDNPEFEMKLVAELYNYCRNNGLHRSFLNISSPVQFENQTDDEWPYTGWPFFTDASMGFLPGPVNMSNYPTYFRFVESYLEKLKYIAIRGTGTKDSPAAEIPGVMQRGANFRGDPQNSNISFTFSDPEDDLAGIKNWVITNYSQCGEFHLDSEEFGAIGVEGSFFKSSVSSLHNNMSLGNGAGYPYAYLDANAQMIVSNGSDFANPDLSMYSGDGTVYFSAIPGTNGSDPGDPFGNPSKVNRLYHVSGTCRIGSIYTYPTRLGSASASFPEVYPTAPNQTVTRGWSLKDMIIIAAPVFKTKINKDKCGVCQGCNSGGDGSASLQCFHYSIDLGTTQKGDPIGKLYVTEESLRTNSFNLASFILAKHNNVDLVYENRQLRQIVTYSRLIDVISNSPSSYSLRIYTNQAKYKANKVNEPESTPVHEISVQKSPTSKNGLVFKEKKGAHEKVTLFTYAPEQALWTMSMAGSDRNETRQDTWNSTYTHRTNTYAILSGTTVNYQQIEVFEIFPWGEEIIQRFTGSMDNPITEEFHYETRSDVAYTNDYSRLIQRVDANGKVIDYHYDAPGRLVSCTESFGAPNSGMSRSFAFSYAAVFNDSQPWLTTTESIAGHPVSSRQYYYNSSSQECRVVESVDATTSLTTKVLRDPETLKVIRTIHPDNTVELNSEATDINGYRYSTVKRGRPNGDNTGIVDGVQEDTIKSAEGLMIQTETRAIRNTVLGPLLTQELHQPDPFVEHQTNITYLNGVTVTQTYGTCCGLESETDLDGVLTSYGYDTLGRLTSITRLNIVTEKVLDAVGNVLVESRYNMSVPPQNRVTLTNFQAQYDWAGRKVRETNALGSVTQYDYFRSNGWNYARTTYAWGTADQSVHDELINPDGSLESERQAAAHPVRYVYGVEQENGYWRAVTTTIPLNAQGIDTGEWTKEYHNGLGQVYLKKYADNSTQRWSYNPLGQLYQEIDPVNKTTEYGYNLLSELETTSLIDPSGQQNRLTRTTRLVLPANEIGGRERDIIRVETRVLQDNGSEVLVQTVDQSTDGRFSWTVQVMDSRSLETSRQTEYSGYQRTETTTRPDDTQIKRIYQDGRLQTEQDLSTQASGRVVTKSVSYGYDEFGRVQTVTDSRTGMPVTYRYNGLDAVTRLEMPPPQDGPSTQTTEYIHDALGRLRQTIFPDSQSAYQDYKPTGELTNNRGARTYGASYVYDARGRMSNLLMTNQTGTVTTTWGYNAQRGWLDYKQYPENGSFTRYTDRNLAGQVKEISHEKANTTPVIAKQSYNWAGQLETLSSNTTTTATYHYDRVGRLKESVGGGVTNAIGYNYLGLKETETFTGGVLNGVSLTHQYNVQGQRESLVLQWSGGSVSYSYGYDSAGRLARVDQLVNGQVNTRVQYSYWPHSDLVHEITAQNGGAQRVKVVRDYDRYNRLFSYKALPSQGDPWGRTNLYNLAGQVDLSKSLDGSYWDYDYNERSEVTGGVKRWSDNSLIGGHDFGYSFDASGNRLTARHDAQSFTYTPNSLNQYASRNTPAVYLHLLGLAPSGQGVTVTENGVNVTATRRDDFFYGARNRGALSSPLETTVTIQTSGGASQSGKVRLPPANEVFTYDNRGNLLSDGLWDYGWDAHSRLVWAQSRTWAAQPHRLEMTYDGLGRRIQRVFKINGAVQENIVYVYDGWLLLAELNGLNNNALLRSYGWGLDLSGSQTGAGGVGGLLWIHNQADGKVHDAVCDGQGNVVGLIDGSNGQVSARYEYGPFGEVIRQTGSIAKVNPFRFSTKYTDEETELVYYGYRYFSPTLGRWLSRDPIEEEGGLNLYGFVGNNPICKVDDLGLAFYAVDGTWTDAAHDANPWQLVSEVKETPRRYFRGPSKGATGSDALGIARDVKAKICQDYCQAKQKCKDLPINMTGWSRGAIIVAGVAQMLNNEGCTCGAITDVPVNVNWIGLFDAVAMMRGEAWWPVAVPPNVAHFNHAIKTAKQAIFPTWHFAGANERTFNRYDGKPTLHVDIGESRILRNNGAYDWIKEQAIAAGVRF